MGYYKKCDATLSATIEKKVNLCFFLIDIALV